MSIVLKLDSIDPEIRKKLAETLKVQPKDLTPQSMKKFWTKPPPAFNMYSIRNDMIHIPFHSGICLFDFQSDDHYSDITCEFSWELFPRQKHVLREVQTLLYNYRSCILSFHTGWGKTLFGIYLICLLKTKTIIYCPRIVLMEQWKTSINNACYCINNWSDGSVTKDKPVIQILSTSKPVNPDADIYLMNPTNASKIKIPKDIGLLIVDEGHMMCTEAISKSFFEVQPKYAICLTATPERSDERDKVLELVFGPHIVRKPLWALFNVYKINTGIQLVLSKDIYTDKIIWGKVLRQQALSKDRCELICNIVRYFKTRNILVCCKLKSHALLLNTVLKNYNIDSDVFLGSKKYINYECKVLIVTYSKGGVGMDCPKMDTLIVAADAEENWIQYLGRIFRVEYHIPMVFDLVDSLIIKETELNKETREYEETGNSKKGATLDKHFNSRKKIYTESGGYVKDFNYSFPGFKNFTKCFGTKINNFEDLIPEVDEESESE